MKYVLYIKGHSTRHHKTADRWCEPHFFVLNEPSGTEIWYIPQALFGCRMTFEPICSQISFSAYHSVTSFTI